MPKTCFTYTPGDNWGFQVGGNEASNTTSDGSAAFLSSNPSYNTGGVQTGDDVSGWLGLRDNQKFDNCAPGYSPPQCDNVYSKPGIFIQTGTVSDYPSYHGLFAQTTWRGRVDCGPNTTRTVFSGDFTSTSYNAITYDCSVANPALDGFDLTNGSWIQIIPQYGDRVNVYVGNTWIMAIFDQASQVNNNELIQETNLYGSPSAELNSGNFDLTSSRTMYLSGGNWVDYPPLAPGGASAWLFTMSTLDVPTMDATYGNNPCMFYDPNTIPNWVGTQAGFGGVTSSMEAGRDVVDCWYDDDTIIHTGIQRSAQQMKPSPVGKPFAAPPFPSHHSQASAPPTTAPARAPTQPTAVAAPVTPTPTSQSQPVPAHRLPPAPLPPATSPLGTATPAAPRR